MSDERNDSRTAIPERKPVDYCVQHFDVRLSPDVEICGKHLNSDHRCVFFPAYPAPAQNDSNPLPGGDA